MRGSLVFILLIGLLGPGARAVAAFPPTYPPDDAAWIDETLRQYLLNFYPELDAPELRSVGAAAALVTGLELNHQRLSPANQRAVLFSIGALLLRAITDRAFMGQPVGAGASPFGHQSYDWQRPDDLRVRGDLSRLLKFGRTLPPGRWTAAGLLREVADGRFLPDLRADGVRYRNEAAEMVRRVLAREHQFRRLSLDADETRRFRGLAAELAGPTPATCRPELTVGL